MGTRGAKGGEPPSWWSKNHSPPEDLSCVVKYTAFPPLAAEGGQKLKKCVHALKNINNSTKRCIKTSKNLATYGGKKILT